MVKKYNHPIYSSAVKGVFTALERPKIPLTKKLRKDYQLVKKCRVTLMKLSPAYVKYYATKNVQKASQPEITESMLTLSPRVDRIRPDTLHVAVSAVRAPQAGRHTMAPVDTRNTKDFIVAYLNAARMFPVLIENLICDMKMSIICEDLTPVQAYSYQSLLRKSKYYLTEVREHHNRQNEEC